MPLTPSQILSANSKLFGGSSGGGVAALINARKAAKDAELEALLAQEEEEEPSEGIWDRAKGVVSGAIEPVARGLDYARAAVVAGAVEGADVLRDIAGKETFGTKGGASFGDLQRNINRRIGVGDVLEENTITEDMPLNVKRVLGGVGDVALDPLNYVTLGGSTVAKAGLRRVAASQGDEVAQVLAREGADAADNLLAERFAREQAEAAARREAAEAVAEPTLPGFGPTLPSPGLDDVAGTAPTIRSILAEGATERGLGRTLSAIDRTGRGGVRFAGRTMVEGDTLARLPGVSKIKAGGQGLKYSGTGQAVRKALVPFTETRDAFGNVIADALPGIGHRRAQLVDTAKANLDARLDPLLKAANPETLAPIRAALDVGGSVDEALAQLDGLPDAQELLRTLAAVRDESYDALIRAGKSPDELMAKDEYLRHRLTAAGKAEFGIKDARSRPGTKTGKFKSRTREGSIDEKLADDGFASYIDDPVRLVGSSYHYAQEVLGNAGAVDALEDVARKAHGVEVTDVVSRKAKEGFVQVSPNGWVPQEIADDLFNLAKSGTQSAIVRGWDTFSSLVKRQTLFNPIAFGPYFAQNMATGVAMNAAKIGAGPAEYKLVFALRTAVKRALKEGGEEGFDTALARLIPDAGQRALAVELRREGIFSAKRSLFDDIAEEGDYLLKPSRKRRAAEFGTHRTAQVNQFGEEMLRGAAFVKARTEGLASDAAADLVRKTHLDYSALGRTRFERDKINRFIFFPTWLMRAPTAIVKAYAHKPGLFNLQAKAELGKDWSDRPRNQYGDIIGRRVSGPVSFLTGLGFEGGDAFDKPTELLHPMLQAAVDEDSRRITDILPPLSRFVTDKGEGIEVPGGTLAKLIDNEPGERQKYLESVFGVRRGIDYDAERGKDSFQAVLDERIAKRKENPDLPETTPTIRLRLAAIEAGVGGNVYTMNGGSLARALLERGYDEKDIQRILDDDKAKLPKRAPAVVTAAAGPQGFYGGDLSDVPLSDVQVARPEIFRETGELSPNLEDRRGLDHALIRELLAAYIEDKEGFTGNDFAGNFRRSLGRLKV